MFLFVMNKTDIEKIVKREITDFITNKLDDEIGRIVKQKNSKGRKETLELVKDAMESVYKVLWQKRNFWKSDIK